MTTPLTYRLSADGSTRFLLTVTNPAVLRAACTRAAGEPTSDSSTARTGDAN